MPVSDVQLIRPEADKMSVSNSVADEPSVRLIQADTEVSTSNNNRRPGDSRLQSPVRVMRRFTMTFEL